MPAHELQIDNRRDTPMIPHARGAAAPGDKPWYKRCNRFVKPIWQLFTCMRARFPVRWHAARG
jgi:hypothetical protein